MSVIRSERSVANTEFIYNALKLEEFTIHKCANVIPKRYTFYISTKLVDLASDITALLIEGNSIYPTNQHEVQLRRDLFLQAYGKCNSLVSKVELAKQIVKFETRHLEEWSRLLSTELKLIKGALESDRKRYISLP